MLLPWIRRFAPKKKSRPVPTRRRQPTTRLQLEPLEARLAPASLVWVKGESGADANTIVTSYKAIEADGQVDVFVKLVGGEVGFVNLFTRDGDFAPESKNARDGRPSGEEQDYFAVQQLLTFTNDGEVKKVSIQLLQDSINDNNQKFFAKLEFGPGFPIPGLTIPDDEVEITIQDLLVNLKVSDTTLAENNTDTSTITAELVSGKAPVGGITVQLAFGGTATFGEDYVTAGGQTSIFIDFDKSSGTLVLTSKADTLDEPDADGNAANGEQETIVIDIDTVDNAAENGTQTKTIKITDNDDPPTVSFTTASSPGSSTRENVTVPGTLVVKLSAKSGKQITVPFTVATTGTAGQDFKIEDASGNPVTQLVFAPGTDTLTIPLTIVDDDEVENVPETITVTLGAPTDASLGATTQHVYTINDNDPTVSFKTPTSSGAEDQTGLVEVILNAAQPGGTIEVEFTVSPAPGAPDQPTNGAPPNDFNLASGVVTFVAGDTSEFIDLKVFNDLDLNEPPENVVITLTNIKTGTASLHSDATKLTHTYTILDGARVSFAAATSPPITEPGVNTDIFVEVTLSDAEAQDVTVTFDVVVTPGPGEVLATPGVDFTIASGSLIIPAGQTSSFALVPQQIKVTIHPDSLSEYPELIKIQLTTTSSGFIDPAKNLHTITITDDDPNTVPKLSRNPTQDLPILDRSVDEGTQLTVDLFGIDPDVVPGAQSLEFTIESALPAGVVAAIVPDAGNPKHAELQLTGANGPLTFDVTIRVTDNFDAASFDEQTFSVTIDNVLPTQVSAGLDQTVDEGSIVALAGTFVDPANPLFETRTFLWTVNASNGQAVTDLTGQNFTGQTLSFRPNDNGTYTVTFTMADDVGAGTPGSPPDADNVVVITVNNVLPVVGFMPDVTTPAGVAFTNSGFFDDPGSVDNWTVTADFGDGTSANIAFAPHPFIPNRFIFTVSHAYALAQTSPVQVDIHVADKEQQGALPPTSSSTSFQVIIAPVTPDDCLTNASFEALVPDPLNDPIPEWDVAAGGNGVQTQLFGIAPTHGAQYAVIDSVDFGPGTSTASFVGPHAQVGTDGTVLTKRFEINDLQTLTFFYDFLTNEGTPSFFNDFARGDLFRLNPDGSVAETFFLFAEDTQSVFQAQPVFGSGFAFHTGFKSVSFDPNPILNPGTAGTNTYLLQLVVSDVIDTVVSSGLALDEFRLTNLKPVIDPLPAAPVFINEGAPFSQQVAFTDEPGCDTWSATVDFGDGSVSTFGVGQAFTLNHTYADDGAYTVRVTVQDTTDTYLEHLTSDPVQMTVNVQNVNPTLTVVGNQPPPTIPPTEILEGQVLNIVNIGAILDPGFDNPLNPNQQPGGSKETFTFTINWGDGSAVDAGSATIDQVGSPGILTQASFDGTHTYLNDSSGQPGGVYTVTVTVTDDDGGVSAVKTFQVTVKNVDIFVTSTDAGTVGKIRVFDANTKLQKFLITPFPGFTGGIRVATGDVNGDGRPDIIAGQGPGGGARVRVFDGKTGAAFPLPFGGTIGFKPFPATFTGGVFVASGDINGDGKAEVIVGTNAGIVARVKIFSGDTTALINPALPNQLGGDIFPFGTFTGGVRVAVGDLNGDKKLDLITARGPGTTPEVQTRLNTGASINPSAALSFLAYNQGTTVLRSGVFVAAGDVNGDGNDEIITGPGNASSTVKVFGGLSGALTASFQAYEPTYLGGVRVAATDVNGDGRADIITSPASFGAKTVVRAFDGSTIDAINDPSVTKLTDFFSFFPTFSGAVFAAGNVRRRVF